MKQTIVFSLHESRGRKEAERNIKMEDSLKSQPDLQVGEERRRKERKQSKEVQQAE